MSSQLRPGLLSTHPSTGLSRGVPSNEQRMAFWGLVCCSQTLRLASALDSRPSGTSAAPPGCPKAVGGLPPPPNSTRLPPRLPGSAPAKRRCSGGDPARHLRGPAGLPFTFRARPPGAFWLPTPAGRLHFHLNTHAPAPGQREGDGALLRPRVGTCARRLGLRPASRPLLALVPLVLPACNRRPAGARGGGRRGPGAPPRAHSTHARLPLLLPSAGPRQPLGLRAGDASYGSQDPAPKAHAAGHSSVDTAPARSRTVQGLKRAQGTRNLRPVTPRRQGEPFWGLCSDTGTHVRTRDEPKHHVKAHVTA